MTEIDYEAEYDNRAAVPEHPEFFRYWERAAGAAREALPGARDIAYGPRPRQRMDQFAPTEGATAAQALLFIHGGYWRSLDRSSFSHLARGPVAHGIDTYLPSYSLCPEVGIPDIIEELRDAAVAVHRRTEKRLVVSGHSAGGHLAAAVLATDWKARDAALPADLVTAAQSLSGLFDLAPLMKTSVNDALRLDADTAAAASPALWPAPAGKRIDLIVGGDESSEYHRQTATLAQAWGRGGSWVRTENLPGAHHFSIVASLEDPSSAFTRRLAEFCAAGG